jgi:hypothetical protein
MWKYLNMYINLYNVELDSQVVDFYTKNFHSLCKEINLYWVDFISNIKELNATYLTINENH